MKKILIIIILISVFISMGLTSESLVNITEASILEKAGIAAKFDTEEAKNPLAFSLVVGRFINVFLSMLGVIFIILMIYGGYLWMTAKGNSEEVEKAKDLIMNAFIGLGIVIAAYAITYFVLNILVSKYTIDKSL